LILPHVSAGRRPPAAVQWTAFIVQLAAISAAGSLVGSGIVFGLSLHPGVTFGTIVAYSIERAMFLALLVGVIHCIVILLRDRLDATEQRLRAQTVENERALKLATEARLAALEARVHPHFLFNTLNTVTSLIPTAPARAERLLERLSALLRFSLDTHRGGTLPLREEMKIVRDYLEIEHARFGPRLRFRIEVSEQLGDIEIPALSVQTLVENSVKYAVDPSRDGADILIRTTSEGDSLRIEVADDGPGFSSGSLPAGHGLDNLRNRLATLFADAEALRGESRRLDGRRL
jgi:LytS/YehU family sensor histidine kinase